MSGLRYQHLDPGASVTETIPLCVREGRIEVATHGRVLRIERERAAPSIAGVAVSQARTFVNERRVLVVSYDRDEPPGTLGYAVVVRPGCSVGDHYHHRREERILLLHGRGEFRLLDERPDSPTRGIANFFTVEYPGMCVCVPTGVAHTIVADGMLTVLQVLASSDYDPADDVHVPLSAVRVAAE